MTHTTTHTVPHTPTQTMTRTVAYPWVTPPTLIFSSKIKRNKRGHKSSTEERRGGTTSITRIYFDLIAVGYISTVGLVIFALVTYWMFLTSNEDLHIAWITTAGCFTLVTLIVSLVVRDMFNQSIEDALGVKWSYDITNSKNGYAPLGTMIGSNTGTNRGEKPGGLLMPKIDKKDIISMTHRTPNGHLF